jgi:hypothetical protein
VNFKTASDEQVANRLAELQAQRSELERAITAEDVREVAEAFAEQTRALFASRTPAHAVAGGAALVLDQRADLALAYIVSQPGFVDYLVAQAEAAGVVSEVGRSAKESKLTKLDDEIAKVRAEHNARRIAAAKAEAEARMEAEIAGLEQELAETV